MKKSDIKQRFCWVDEMIELSELMAHGELREKLEGNTMRCLACAQRCLITENSHGNCRVRCNRNGELWVPFRHVSGAQCDPVEKKPFYHVRPGALAFSYGMRGCNFHCDYCQNWTISQVPVDSNATVHPAHLTKTSPEELVAAALHSGAELMISTYNEPLITGEWNAAVFKSARAANLLTGYVSNGYATPEALAYLLPLIDVFKVDLKTFDDDRYRQFGGSLAPVLETIRSLYREGVWVEVVTLLVPGFNDSEDELTKLTEFLSDVSPDIPWHVTAFHRDYRMTGHENTTPEDLLRAAQIGRRSGLRFVYAGNLPGRTGTWENTTCPDCGMRLVERRGFTVVKNQLHHSGICPGCGSSIPGRW